MNNGILYRSVAVEGNIGAGKTTLALRLAKELGAVFIPERFEENPLLPKFYADPERYAFALETSFLEDRFRQLTSEFPAGQPVVTDYYYGKSLVFGRINLSGEELKLFERLFFHFEKTMHLPDLVIYLHRDTGGLRENISRRGRSYEQGIETTYLEKIDAGYAAHFSENRPFPLLHIDTSGKDSNVLFERVLLELRKRFENKITRIP